MRTQIETFWAFALASKCMTLTKENIAPLVLITVLLCLALSLRLWFQPGGHAWGKYHFHNSPASLSFLNPNNNRALIPGPRGFPILGSMSLMSSPVAHRRIAEAAESRGAKRLMAFSLGETRVVVSCHPDVAKDILNSPVFSDRPVDGTAYGLMFNRAIGFAPCGVYWRALRRVAASHFFGPKQIKRMEEQRRVVATQMVNVFASKPRRGFVAREVIKAASLNNMMCSVFGKEYKLDCDNGESTALRALVDEGYDLLGTLNWADHLPWLARFDPQQIKFRCSRLVPKVNHIVTQIIADHSPPAGDVPRDFVDVLLSLQGPDKLSQADMIAVLWEMIFRGTDTIAVVIEWFLARMVLHPDVQSRVHGELDRIVGRSRAVNESDVASLSYLTAVAKEVLRLHPPGPLLSWARLSTTDTTVDGYHVPAGTTAMVNMWAIARDPHVWEDPLEFNPERFVVKAGQPEFSVLGSDLRLAPFGSGRRVCPGKSLGLTTVSFWVATLLHEFEWSLSEEANCVDLSEILKLSCEMASPLTAKVRPRRAVE